MPHASKMIGSVQRAIDILSLFNHQVAELGTTEISRALGLHKSTTASLIYTLEANGYLTQNTETRKYRLGLRLAERVSVMLTHIPLRQVAYPALKALYDEIGETANLAILDGGSVVFVERFLCTKATSTYSEVGLRTHVHSTGVGKAILAFLPEAEFDAFIHHYGLPIVTTHTITDYKNFCAEMDITRQRGYALDNEENELGSRCVAAPILDYTGKPVAAISISIPIQRFPIENIPLFGEKVRDSARSISRNLGYVFRG